MFKNSIHITKTLRTSCRFYSEFHVPSNFPRVNTVPGPFTTLSVEKFRQEAFAPEQPLLITSAKRATDAKTFPAATKWFIRSQTNARESQVSRQHHGKGDIELNRAYLSQFKDTILPYEYITPPHSAKPQEPGIPAELLQFSEDPDLRSTSFHRFHAPLGLFLAASSNEAVRQLYIAQAQLIDLPPALRADLPTPAIVREAGKGDVYDSNIWLGCPPTYTPLHKDPNPNLFLQLGGQKIVRIFQPTAGRAIFAHVKRQLGENGRESMRGAEMMEGKERELLDEAVWGKDAEGGLEATVGTTDALFIPKGWWHSIKSVGLGVNASVNWWFR